MAKTLIQNGTIVNAYASIKADLLIDGATIKEIRAGIPASFAGILPESFRLEPGQAFL